MTLTGDAELDEIWGRYLTDGQLPEADLARLADALQKQPELLARLLDDDEIDGLLRTVNGDHPPFAQKFLERLALEDDERRFVPLVEKRLVARWRWVWFVGMAAAAIAVFALLRPEPQPVAQAPKAQAPVPTAVFTQPPAPPLPLVLPLGELVYTLDFATLGQLSSVEGRLADGPLGRRALAGVPYNPDQNSFGVRIMHPPGLFPYDRDLVLSFEYWLGDWSGDPPQMIVAIHSKKRNREYEVPAPTPVAVHWTSVTIDLNALHDPFPRQPTGRVDFASKPLLPPGAKPDAGMAVDWLKVRVEGLRADVLFIDNVRVHRRGR